MARPRHTVEPNIEPHSLRLYLRGSLRNHYIRRTCTAVEHIMRAIDILDEVPQECLEEVRDYCADYIKGRKDVYSDFKRAWVALVAEHLSDLRVRERRLARGITGEDTGE